MMRYIPRSEPMVADLSDEAKIDAANKARRRAQEYRQVAEGSQWPEMMLQWGHEADAHADRITGELKRGGQC